MIIIICDISSKIIKKELIQKTYFAQFGFFKTHLKFFNGSMYTFVVLYVNLHTWQIRSPL